MSAEIMIMIITLGSASMSIVFLFSVMRNIEVTPERIIKIFGEENIAKVKQAKDDEEIRNIIKSLNKKQKTQLKTLLESQDIRIALNALKTHIRGEEPIEILD